MKNLLTIVGLTLVMSACTSTDTNTLKCKVQDALVGAGSTAIAGGLKCSSPDAIKADLDAALSKASFCKRTEDAKGGISVKSIGSDICDSIVKNELSTLTGKIPASWNCTGGTVKDTVQSILLAQCAKL